MHQPAPEWALEFDQKSTELIDKREFDRLINYRTLGNAAEISVNSAEHYIPLLYTLALANENDPITYTNQLVDNTIIGVSMRCIRVG
jgi:4,5-DOPA dioxygenase extradiol